MLLMVLFLATSIGFASNTAKSENLPIMNSYTANSCSADNFSGANLLASLNNQLISDLSELPVLQCSVSAKGTLDLGLISFEITVTVSGDCNEVKASGQQIANDILQAFIAYIKANF